MPNISTHPISTADISLLNTVLHNLFTHNSDRDAYLVIKDLIDDPIMDDVTAAEMRKIFIEIWNGYWTNGVQGPSDNLMLNKLKIDPSKIEWSRVSGITKSFGKPTFQIPTAGGNYGDPWVTAYTLKGTFDRFSFLLTLRRDMYVGNYRYKLRHKKFSLGFSCNDMQIDSHLAGLSVDSGVLRTSPTSVQSYTTMATDMFTKLMGELNRDNRLSTTIIGNSRIGSRYDIYR